jgi:hypothetical protein
VSGAVKEVFVDLRAEIRLDLPLGTIAAAGGDDHPAMLEDSILPNRLSAAQHQFADAHNALAVALGIDLHVSQRGAPHAPLAR